VNYFESASPETEQHLMEQPLRVSPVPGLPREQRQSQIDTDSRIEFAASDTMVEEQRLSTSSKSDGGVQQEVFPQNHYDLSYACLLIPRFSEHYLTGDISISLPVWMKAISISYGWRLESIIVRPGYLQWLISVPPDANPAQIMRITRQHTSQKILLEFPRFKQQNLSGDFWAPGYSVISGNQFHAPETISKFIQITRMQQGIY
jgi:REP element-mobilizing transposase RayT